MEKVALVPCGAYEEKQLDAAVERIFDLCGFGEVLRPGVKVLIKPNLIGKRVPDTAATTHPGVVAAVVRAVNKYSPGKVVIADSPGGMYTKETLRQVYKATGMAKAAESEGAELNFDTGFSSLSVPEGVCCKSFNVISPYFEADVVINVAKLKTHAMTGMSAAVKNLFGFVPGLQKPELHFRFPNEREFCEMIVDLAVGIKPAISIIDGVVGMEGNGPTSGKPKHCGVLLGSASPFAADVAAAKIIGFEPGDISILKNAINRGLCPASADEIECVGEPLERFAGRGFKKPDSRDVDFLKLVPRFLRGFAGAVVTPRPYIIRKSCIGCEKCRESCPAEAISMEERKARIDYKKCIKCYCCHEMCPVRSVGIRRFKLLDL